jgi:hypothetical protein
MKTTAVLSLLVACALSGYAQGLVQFSNLSISGGGVNAPVFESDGVTKCSGQQFMAQLFAGAAPDNLASIATTGFLVGTAAGYFDGLAQTIPHVAPGNTAWVQVAVWNTASGATFDQARVSGLPNSWWQSAVFTVVPGGGNVNPTPPSPLTGLGFSPVYLNSVPEPSALAVFSCGLALALFRKGLTKQ